MNAKKAHLSKGPNRLNSKTADPKQTLFIRKLYQGRRIDLYNREMSWLDFNERVLQEAEHPMTPLGERLNFMSIFSSNMDEFFRVRVANQRRLSQLGLAYVRKLDFHPRQVLAQIHLKAQELQDRFEALFSNHIRPELEESGFVLCDEQNIPKNLLSRVDEIFQIKVQPYLNPIILNSKTRKLRLRDAYLYFAVRLEYHRKSTSTKQAILEIPVRYTQRFYALGEVEGKQYVIFLDDIVRLHLTDIFRALAPSMIQAYTIKITRDQELDLEHDMGQNLLDKMRAGLRKRGKGEPVRFLYDSDMPDDLLKVLVRKFKVKSSDLIAGGRYHNFKDLRQFPLQGRTEHFYPHWPTCSPGPWSEQQSLFKAIRDSDRLVHHPYHSYDIILKFLREAALDPGVRVIEITLYRLAPVSSVVRSLITAALNGKKVRAIVEIQARFDEENNIFWAEKLQEAGAEVLYGFEGMKVHCKLCLVTRREKNKDVRYAHMSTGNYNAQTAKIYADDGLLTCSPALTAEASRLFKSLYKGQFHYAYRHLLVAPYFLRQPLLSLIDFEIQQASKGQSAWIFLKLNSLVDEGLIAGLYRASQAGVQIRCIVRGICSLVPGIPQLSENIQMISIIDRYLEHSRVYAFGHGNNTLIYLSSADWMARNMDHRVELAFPLESPLLGKEMLDLMEIQWSDYAQSRYLNGPMANQMRKGSADQTHDGRPPLRAQAAFHDYLRHINLEP
jgi:polyphosphate kinase